jgi:xylulokinase
VTAEAARITGIPEGTPVIAGTADAGSEAFSVGVLDPGDMLLMFGSSIFIIHVVREFTVDQRLWAGPYLFPGTYAVAAGMSTTGTLTRWFKENFAKDLVQAQEAGGQSAYAAMMEEAAALNIPPGSDGLVVLPYFSGERTPINDPKAKGVIFGLNLLHSRAHVYQACLEGVGYGIAQHFDIFDERQMGTKKVMAVGGGVKNPMWLQIVSDISGKPLVTAQESLGAAYGDALLAALGIGFYRDSREVAGVIRHKSTVLPNADNTEKYRPYKDIYARLYGDTKELMHSMDA